MKKYIIIIISVFWVMTLFAQNTTTYQYDNKNQLSHSSNENVNIQYNFDELGNRTQLNLAAQASSQADLVVQNTSIPTNAFEQGASLIVLCDINNIGTDDASGSYLKVYLANTNTGTDIELAGEYISLVPAGSSVTKDINITIPQDAAVGNKYLVFFADATNLIAESNENNNKASESVIIQESASPDLSVDNQQINPTSLLAGESTYISADILNTRNENASDFWFRCYLSLNPTFESYNDTELTNAAYHFTSLNAGVTTAYGKNVSIPSGMVPGIYYLLFVVDPENTISESNENNNVVFSTLTITEQGGGNVPLSDFVVDNQIIGQGTMVQFADLSTNNPTTWQWSFPGGTPAYSTSQNPSITYESNGVFDVTLSASNSSGANTITKSAYVSVGQPSEYDWIWSNNTSIDINDLTLDPDENIITVGGDNPTYLAKFDPEGNDIWINTINNCRGHSLDVNNNGDIIIVGEFSGTVNFGNNISVSNTYDDGWDGYIAKFNNNGECQWAKKIYNSDVWNTPNSYNINIIDVCFDNSGNSYLTGSYEGLYGSEYNYLHFPNGINLRNINQSNNLMVAKFSPDGTTLWAKQGNDYNNSISSFDGNSIDTDGNHVGIVGQFSGTVIFNDQTGYVRKASGLNDIFFIECNTTDGYMNAFMQYGSNSTNTNSWDYEVGRDIKYGDNGTKYIAGQFAGTAQFDVFQRTSSGHADAFLMKLYSYNSTEWVVTGGSSNFDCGNDISFTPDGDIYMVGQHDAGFVVNDNSLDGYGTYILLYDGNGDVLHADNVLGSFYNDNGGGGIEANNESNLLFGLGSYLAKYGHEGVVLHPMLQCENTQICAGETTIINAPPNYQNYLWSSGETTSSITINASGDYYVDVTDDMGNTGRSDTISIIVSQIPSASITVNGSTTICEGDYIELSANTGTEVTYQWLKDGEYIAGANSQTYQASIAGGYQAEVSNIGNCSALSNSISIDTEPSFAYINIVASENEICDGTEVVFTASTENEGSNPKYQWKINDNDIGSNSNSFTLNSLSDGDEIKCILTASGSCISNNPVESNPIILDVNPVYNENANAEICNGETYQFGTQSLTQSGTYTEVFESVSGCDSTVVLTLKVVPQPNVEFNASITSGTAPLNVQFTDESTGDPVIWLWSFGDGGTSEVQHPQYVYNTPGIYTVSLFVNNGLCEDEQVNTNYINVLQPAPVADFSGIPLSGDAPLDVNFTDLSANNPDTWSWDFGDGGSSSSQNPCHAYNAPGTYSVSLTVSNSGGSDTEIKTDYIHVYEVLTVNAGDDQALGVGLSTQFDGSYSGGSGNVEISWEGVGNNIPISNPNILNPSVGLFLDVDAYYFSLSVEDLITGETQSDEMMVDVLLGLEECSLSGIKVYPNPTNGKLWIKSEESIESIKISDALGSDIIRLKTTEKTTVINLSTYPNGVYLMQIYMKDGLKTFKVVKN